MADSKTPLQDQWESFRRVAVHPDTGSWQLAEMRRVFFAGALGLLVAAPDDIAMRHVDAELDAFEVEMQSMVALSIAAPAGRA